MSRLLRDGSTVQGILYDVEPDIDSDFYLDFEDIDPKSPAQGGPYQDNAEWHRAFLGLLKDFYGIEVKDLCDIVGEMEARAWMLAADRLVDAGYGVYDSDSRFEIYLLASDYN